MHIPLSLRKRLNNTVSLSSLISGLVGVERSTVIQTFDDICKFGLNYIESLCVDTDSLGHFMLHLLYTHFQHYPINFLNHGNNILFIYEAIIEEAIDVSDTSSLYN